MKTRIYFLDNLRTFLIFLVIVLHAGLVYESVLENTWIVCDPVKNNSIGLIRMYLDLFIMFAIFFISGYFIPFSLKNKNTWGFIKSKIVRIIVPWIIAVLTLIPAYKAIFLYSRNLPQEEWFSYFHFFERTGTDLSFFANNPAQNWLWFLPVLFMFQMVYLAMSRMNLLSFKISLKTGVILTFIIGLIYSMLISNLGLTGWTHNAILHFQNERLLIYFLSFLLGTLCNKLNVFESNKKNKKTYIIANIVLSIAMGVFTVVALNIFFNMIDPARNYFFVSEFVDKLIYYISALLLMLSFLYIFIYVFRFKFNKTNDIISRLNKNSYSVYIIHTIMLGIIALTMVNLSIPVFVKFLILTILTFTISNMLIYSCQKAKQKIININTIATILIVTLIFAAAFWGYEDNDVIEQNQSSELQTIQDRPNASIHEAAITGNIEVIKQYIKIGSDLNKKEPSGGSSALITAAVFGKTEVARALIEAGADINLKNNDGSTALHSAAFFCRTEIVQVLLENGADKSLKNNAGSTALESVLVPFDTVKNIYGYFGEIYGPLGLEIDNKQIKMTRPRIVEMLQ